MIYCLYCCDILSTLCIWRNRETKKDKKKPNIYTGIVVGSSGVSTEHPNTQQCSGTRSKKNDYTLLHAESVCECMPLFIFELNWGAIICPLSIRCDAMHAVYVRIRRAYARTLRQFIWFSFFFGSMLLVLFCFVYIMRVRGLCIVHVFYTFIAQIDGD